MLGLLFHTCVNIPHTGSPNCEHDERIGVRLLLKRVFVSLGTITTDWLDTELLTIHVLATVEHEMRVVS